MAAEKNRFSDSELEEFKILIQNKLNVTCINEIINYIILIQIELFDKYGFVWHKLSLSNILVEKGEELIQNIYKNNLSKDLLKNFIIVNNKKNIR